jgi:hypothetical protein
VKEVNAMNVLVLIAHPHLKNLRVNRRWKQELEGVLEVTIHDLYAQYPDECIDVKRELTAEDETINQSAAAYVQHITTPQARRYRMAIDPLGKRGNGQKPRKRNWADSLADGKSFVQHQRLALLAAVDFIKLN